MKAFALSYATEKMLSLKKRLKTIKIEEKLQQKENSKISIPSTDSKSISELDKIKHFKN